VILVTGATGNVGGELVHTLVDAGQDVRALARDPGKSAFPPGVELACGDLNQPQSLTRALAGVRQVFLLSGYQDMPGLLASMRDAGVEHVVLLSGSSAGSGDLTNAISRYMIGSEAAVHASGIGWTVLRPYGFMSNALQWAGQLRAGDVVRAPFGNARVAVIDPYDIAAVAAATLSQEGHRGGTYVLSGPEPSRPVDRVRVLAAVLGRDLQFQAQPDAEARAEMSAAMPAEYVDAFFSFFAGSTLDESAVLPTVERLTGRRPRTFEQWARAHADAFQ
jgi:uncharacterized protein YbjT (DUF2867 family)